MREILFRGKRLDNGEWVEGYLVKTNRNTFIMYPNQFNDDLFLSPGNIVVGVDPATVGQYTGLMENGKRIFEGDIVRYFERQLGGKDAQVVQYVGYEEGGFCVHNYFLNNWLRNAVNGNIQLEDIEIIGNIHDNPELVKGGEGDS